MKIIAVEKELTESTSEKYKQFQKKMYIKPGSRIRKDLYVKYISEQINHVRL